jgi:pimeloyl-ACP methyl ester carboxylesterase
MHVLKSQVDLNRGFKKTSIIHDFRPDDSEKPTIISIGGWASGAHLYTDSSKLLADKGFRTMVIPLRGNVGNMIASSTPRTYVQDMAEDVLQYIETMRIPNVILMGHSCGFNIALRINALILEKNLNIEVKGMVADAPATPDVVSAFSKTPTIFSYSSIIGKTLVKWIDKLCTDEKVTKAAEGVMKFAAKLFTYASRILLLKASKEAREANRKFWEGVSHIPTSELAGSLSGVQRNRFQAHADLEQVTVPVLTIGYQYDYLVDRHRARYVSDIAETCKARNTIIDNEGHFGQTSNPRAFVDVVVDFIQRNVI